LGLVDEASRLSGTLGGLLLLGPGLAIDAGPAT
jgi:hypothetical protein